MLLLVAAALLGGSSRPDAPTLLVLRPLSVILLGYGLIGLSGAQVRAYRWLFAFAGVWTALLLLQLVPLPPIMWKALPGRETLAAAADLIGTGDRWRPFHMTPWRGWNAVFALAVPLAALALAAQCPPRALRALVPVVIALGLASALAGVVQAARGSGGWTWLYPITTGWAPPGLFANRNHQAIMLSCLIPLIAWWGARRDAGDARRHVREAACVAGILALLALVLVTGSRAGVVACVVALACVPALLPPGTLDRRAKWFAVAALAVVVLGLVAFGLTRAVAIERLLTVGAEAEPRMRYWPSSLDAAALVMPLGGGIGSFVDVFQITEPGYMLAPTYLNHAHNEPIEIAIEAGLAGLAILVAGVAAYVMGVVQAWQNRAADSARLALSGGVAMFLLGLGSLVDYPVRVPSLAGLFAISAVWLVAGTRGRE